MILNQKIVSIAEAKSYIKNLEEKQVLNDYFKKFSILSFANAEKLIGELKALNNMKLREEHFVKIADMMPSDAEDLAKITNDVSLTEEEAQAVLSLVKNYS
jgi:DNA-directed RNA polymerase subunit F